MRQVAHVVTVLVQALLVVARRRVHRRVLGRRRRRFGREGRREGREEQDTHRFQISSLLAAIFRVLSLLTMVDTIADASRQRAVVGRAPSGARRMSSSAS